VAKSLFKLRSEAFRRQAGRCHYCDVLMWMDDGPSFARTHSMSVQQAEWLRCTAEHLLARQDGGKDSADNIVAACLRCNRMRHQGWKKALPAERFVKHVRQMLSRKVWHRSQVFERGLIAGD